MQFTVQSIIVNISFPLPLKRLVQFDEIRRVVAFGFAPEFQISTYLSTSTRFDWTKDIKFPFKINTLFLVLHFDNCPHLEHTSAIAITSVYNWALPRFLLIQLMDFPNCTVEFCQQTWQRVRLPQLVGKS